MIMNSFSLAIGIWARTIFINTIIGSITIAVIEGTNIFLTLFFFFMGAVVFTSPLLILITAMVRISGCLPYDADIKIKWLCFMLMLLVVGFYGVFILFFGQSIAHDKEFLFFGGGTMVSVLIAIRFSRKSLTELIART
jgi:hypothetical protein